MAQDVLYRLVMSATTKKNVAPARNHLPCRCCKRYELSTDLVNGTCRDCAGELTAMDARAERMLETIGQGEDTY